MGDVPEQDPDPDKDQDHTTKNFSLPAKDILKSFPKHYPGKKRY
jgi:hypothetical protein